MDIIFTKNITPLGTIHCDLDESYHILFSDATVKEFQITHTINDNEDRFLRTIYEQISNINYYEATDTIIYFSNNVYYDLHCSIKTILNRTAHYMNHGKMENIEMLSIRFVDDEEPIRCNEFVKCSEHCQYLKNNTCNKYKEDLKVVDNMNMVCERCFLNSKESLLNEDAKLAYTNMEKQFKVFDN